MNESQMTTEEINGEIDKALDQFATMFIEAVKQKTPVDTGKLKEAWQVKRDGVEIMIENATPYAGHVEYGTEKMRPVGMLTSTINESERIMARAIQRTKLK